MGLALSLALTPFGAWAQAPAPAAAASPGKQLVAVLELEAVGSSKEEASAMTDRLREELLKSGRYTLVDRELLNRTLQEQALQQSGCTTQECAVQVGKMLGVRKMISGRVTKLGEDRWQLSATLVDVETSETQRAESVRFRGDYFNLLDAGIVELAAKLAAGAEPGKPVPQVGTLRILSNARDTRISRADDNRQLGIAQPGTPLDIANLPAGNLTLRYEAPGYQTGAVTVTIAPGRVTDQAINLASGEGTLLITTNAPGTKVTNAADGRELGTSNPSSPLRVNLPEGFVTLRFEAAGFQTATETTSVAGGRLTEKAAVLRAAAAPVAVDQQQAQDRSALEDQYQRDMSSWRKKWAWGLVFTAVFAAGAASEAAAVDDSTKKQKTLSTQAQSATTATEFNAYKTQMQTEYKNGKSASDASSGLGALAGLAGLYSAYQLFFNKPKAPALALEIEPVPLAGNGIGLTLTARF